MRPTRALLLLALLCACPGNATAAEIHWFTSADKAWTAAKHDKRPLLIYFTSSSCHWCVEMKTKTFSDPEVAAYIDKTFVAVAVKVEDEKEQELAKMLEIKVYPTTVIISPDKKLLERMEGYVPPATFHKRLAEVTPKNVPR